MKYVSRKYLNEKWDRLKWDMEKVIGVNDDGADDASEEAARVRGEVIHLLDSIRKEMGE